MTENEVLKTTAEVARMLNVSTKTVLRTAKRRGVQPMRLVREYRFSSAQVQALVTPTETSTTTPTTDKADEGG